MSSPAATVSMPTVTSKDGTTIACERTGSGPAVILVDGAMGYRAFGWSPRLAALLAPACAVYIYDRRGRGGSGDTQPYSVDREIDDIDALIDAAGGSASLYGISSGGALALEAAAALGDRVEGLAIYEAPYNSSAAGKVAWRRYRRQLAGLLSAARSGDAVALFMTFVGAPAEIVEETRRTPMWPMFESVAPTLAYDAAVLGEDRRVPVDRAATVTAETLVMDGGASLGPMPFMRASAELLTAAIPGARHVVLEGQRHDVDPHALAPVLTDFLVSGRR